MRTFMFFKWDFLITAIALVVAFWYGGIDAAVVAAILIVVEIVFSFDNAAVNAKYLQRLSAFWQKMFLTVGVLIAVFGMRLVFPFVIVCTMGQVSPTEAIRLAIEGGDPATPGTYGYILNQAHPSIAAFGGMFLLLLFLDFLIDAEKDVHWVGVIERAAQKMADGQGISVGIALLALMALVWQMDPTGQAAVLIAGVGGVVTYVLVKSIATVMEARQSQLDAETASVVGLTGKAAFSLFMFLEVLDASFSFDGVIGAFAITPDPIIIAIGLGIGAMYVRSMTIYLVQRGTLAQFRYLEHGAHYAIGALAVMLLLSMHWHLDDLLIGGVGIAVIGASVWSSVRYRKQAAAGLQGDNI